MRRIESLAKRVAKLETTREIEEQPLVLASGLSINIGGADLARLFQEVDGKTRGIPSSHEKAAGILALRLPGFNVVRNEKHSALVSRSSNTGANFDESGVGTVVPLEEHRPV